MNKQLENEAKTLWYKIADELNKPMDRQRKQRVAALHIRAWQRWKRRNDALYAERVTK